MKETVKHLKISKCVVQTRKNEKFRAICFNGNLNLLICNSESDIFRADLSRVKHPRLPASQLSTADIQNICVSQMHQESLRLSRIVDGEYFRKRNEQVIRMHVYQNVFRSSFLLIVTQRGVYQLALNDFDDSRSFESFSLQKITKEVKELFVLSKSNAILSKYTIEDSSLAHEDVVLRLFNEESEAYLEDNPKLPFHLVVKLTLEKSASIEHSVAVDSLANRGTDLEVVHIRYLKVLQRGLSQAVADSRGGEEVYLAVKNKLFKGVFSNERFGDLRKKSRNSSKFDEKQVHPVSECELVFKAKKAINRMHFSEQMKHAYVSEGSNRIAKIDTVNWKRQMAYQISKGHCETFAINENRDKLFV